MQFLARVAQNDRPPFGVLQQYECERANDGWDPQRDRAIDEGGCRGHRPVHSVEDEHADQAAVEYADPRPAPGSNSTGTRSGTPRPMAQGAAVAGGAEAREQHRYVE